MAQVKPVNKKKMTKSALIATIVSIVILVAFVVSLVASSGLFVRIQTAASSDNFTVNGSMMSYFANSYYQMPHTCPLPRQYPCCVPHSLLHLLDE